MQLRSTGPPPRSVSLDYYTNMGEEYLFFLILSHFLSHCTCYLMTQMGLIKHEWCLCIITTSSTFVDRTDVICSLQPIFFNPLTFLIKTLRSFFNLFCKFVFVTALSIQTLWHCILFGFQEQLLQYTDGPTDTHSHHNLTTHILYPMCALIELGHGFHGF